MSKQIIIDLIDYYSTTETEVVKINNIVNELLTDPTVKSIQPIKEFLDAVTFIAGDIVRKGFVKEDYSIVERITLDKNNFMTNINEIDKLITNLDNKQLTSDEIELITTKLNKLKASLSSLMQETDSFLGFMTINKLDTYTQNDITLNNALIQAFKIKKEVNAIQLRINKNNEDIKRINAKTVTQSEVTSRPVSFYSPRNIEEVENENIDLIQKKKYLRTKHR